MRKGRPHDPTAARLKRTALTKADLDGGVHRIDSLGRVAFDWSDFSRKLPTGKDGASEAKRRELFRVIDANGNGVLSLAEFDRGLLEVLGSDYTQRVYRAKPAIMRAFHAAKGANKGSIPKSVGQQGVLRGDDFVDYSEFRLLLAYLRQYFELYLMFQAVDGGELGDRAINAAEFRRAVPMVEAWGSTDGRPPFRIADPAATFAAIDANGSGTIRFDEFAQWALDNRLDLEDDDEVEDVAAPAAGSNLADADVVAKLARTEHAAKARSMMHRPPSAATRAAGRVRRLDGSYDGLRHLKTRLTGQAAAGRKQAVARLLGTYEKAHKKQVLNDMASTMAHLDRSVYEYKRQLEERPPLPPRQLLSRGRQARDANASSSASSLPRCPPAGSPLRGSASAASIGTLGASAFDASTLTSSPSAADSPASPLTPVPHVLGSPPAVTDPWSPSWSPPSGGGGYGSPAAEPGHTQPWDASPFAGTAASAFSATASATAAASRAATASGLRRKPWDARSNSASSGLTLGIPSYDKRRPIPNHDVERLIREQERAAKGRVAVWPPALRQPVPSSSLLPLDGQRSLSTLTVSLETSPAPSGFGRTDSSPSLITSPQPASPAARKHATTPAGRNRRPFALASPERVPGGRSEVRWCVPDTRFEDRVDPASMTWTGPAGSQTTSERVRDGAPRGDLLAFVEAKLGAGKALTEAEARLLKAHSPLRRGQKEAEAAQGVEHDIKLLKEGINRIGKKGEDGSMATTFGELFKDEILEQQLESLVGSLKAAKKRSILTFEGQMLLQGAHDHVVVTLAADHVVTA